MEGWEENQLLTEGAKRRTDDMNSLLLTIKVNNGTDTQTQG